MKQQRLQGEQRAQVFHALQFVMKTFTTPPNGSKSSGELKRELALIKMTEPTTFMEIEPSFRLFITVLESKSNEINHILNPKDEEAHRHRTVSQNDLIVHLGKSRKTQANNSFPHMKNSNLRSQHARCSLNFRFAR
jgi:hypothetical protein